MNQPGDTKQALVECLSTLVYWHDHDDRIDESWWEEARRLVALEQGKDSPTRLAKRYANGDTADVLADEIKEDVSAWLPMLGAVDPINRAIAEWLREAADKLDPDGEKKQEIKKLIERAAAEIVKADLCQCRFSSEGSRVVLEQCSWCAAQEMKFEKASEE